MIYKLSLNFYSQKLTCYYDILKKPTEDGVTYWWQAETLTLNTDNKVFTAAFITTYLTNYHLKQI